MNIQPDFEDLLRLLEENHVDYTVPGAYGDVGVRFIGKADLIRNKRATQRSKDKVDAEELE